MSGGGSHLSVGGETAMGKEASVGFFLLIGGGERVHGPGPARPRRSADGLTVRWEHGATPLPYLRWDSRAARSILSQPGPLVHRVGPKSLNQMFFLFSKLTQICKL
jgi:hypothetical protein